MGKLHHLKPQPIFSEASQTEWPEPVDFPTGFSGFPLLMVASPHLSPYHSCYRKQRMAKQKERNDKLREEKEKLKKEKEELQKQKEEDESKKVST